MAGIGFELRRMIDERDGFLAKVRAYACAGLISSGPWLMTILTLSLLSVAGPYVSGGHRGYDLFRALVTYAFAFSLLITGVVQMAVTRRVADLLYAKEHQRVLPAFAATLLATGLVHGVLAAWFAAWAGFGVTLSCLCAALFAVIGMTWIALIWLSVSRQYDDVLRAYVYGTLVAMVGVVLLLLGRGTNGVLAAYMAGQAFTLMLLVRTIVRGMEAGGKREFIALRSTIDFPRLVGIGLLYNGAIWIDKMVFWFLDGVGPHPFVRYHPLYDTCSFLAYLTVVPALAVNLVRLETSFYEKYREYYSAILGGTPLKVIDDKRSRMLGNLGEGVVRLLRIQGAITIAVILFAPPIVEFLELPPAAIRVFRLTCLGALFHVLLLITILMQMYFDLRTQALATSLVFFVLNGTLAWWSVHRGIDTYGVGYALASFLSLLLGFLLLHRALDRLDYMTFTSQPISTDRPEEAAPDAVPEQAQDESEDENNEDKAKDGDAPAKAPVPTVTPAPFVASPKEPPLAAPELPVRVPEPQPETAASAVGAGEAGAGADIGPFTQDAGSLAGEDLHPETSARQDPPTATETDLVASPSAASSPEPGKPNAPDDRFILYPPSASSDDGEEDEDTPDLEETMLEPSDWLKKPADE